MSCSPAMDVISSCGPPFLLQTRVAHLHPVAGALRTRLGPPPPSGLLATLAIMAVDSSVCRDGPCGSWTWPSGQLRAMMAIVAAVGLMPGRLFLPTTVTFGGCSPLND